MKDPFVLFWAVLIFASIFWYAFLVVYIGLRAPREILAMIKTLTEAQSGDQDRSAQSVQKR